MNNYQNNICYLIRKFFALMIILIFIINGNIAYAANVDSAKADVYNARSVVNNMTVGWTVGDSLDSYYGEMGYDINPNMEIKWGNPKITPELITVANAFGFNTIRIPVTWTYNCGRDANGHLIIGQQYLSRVKEVVDYAMMNNMYIILDTHHELKTLYAGVEDPTEWNRVQQDARDLWTQIATAFKDYNVNLMFEGYNELDNKVTGFTYSELASQQMNILNQIFVDTVRKTGGNNGERVLICPTLFHATKTDVLNGYQLPIDSVSDRLIVAVHSYEDEYDQEIDWIFQTLEDFSNRVGAPVIIDEFGAKASYQLTDYRAKFSTNYIARAKAHGIKCVVWDDGYSWKLIDRYDFTKSNFQIIKAYLDGLSGIAYETPASDMSVFTNMDNFYFGAVDVQTGEFRPVDYKKKYWAVLTTKQKGTEHTLLPVGKGDKISVAMVTKNNAVNFYIYTVSFWDANMNPISYAVGKSSLHKYLCTSIPEGAAYYAVITYDPFKNHTLDQINNYFEQGDMRMSVTFLNSKDSSKVQPVQVQ